MNYPFICVDNFYENPDEIVDYAKSLTYHPDPEGHWPGKRTPEIGTLNLPFFTWVGKKILSCYFGPQASTINFGGSSAFQLINPIEKKAHRLFTDEPTSKGWIHTDSRTVLGVVIYLNKNQDNNNGTSLYRRKKLGVIPIHTDIKEKFYTNNATAEDHKKALKENNEQYEETLKVSSVYNRLIAYDGSQIHGQNFSSSSEDRLTQVMFFQVLNAPVLLPERFRQTG